MISKDKITEIFASQTTFAKNLRKNSQKKYFQIVIMRPKGTASV